MPRGGLNKSQAHPNPDPIQMWPPPPLGFNEYEAREWRALGKALRPLGTVSKSDLILVRLTARTLAKLEQVHANPNLEISKLTALTRLVGDLLGRLGLSPQARSTVGRLQQKEKDDGLEEF